ncbi:MAG: RluA family pseudouridine synthase [Planctomycetota bacterium]
MIEQPSVLFEDNHLLVVNKPAGMATMGAEGLTLHAWAGQYLKHKFNKPGNAYVGIVSRLDRVTSGVIVLARTSKAASRLCPQFTGDPESVAKAHRKWAKTPATKRYLAIVDGTDFPREGSLAHRLLKDEDAMRMRVANASKENALMATLRYRTLGDFGHQRMVEVELETGRKHQIRVQFASIGHPIVGDRKYDSASTHAVGIALHSWRTQIAHPVSQASMTFEAWPTHGWPSWSAKLRPKR